jgi:16S rRNA processing protein RimM
MDELVAIAKIVRTRGLRGELVADMLTDFPARFEGLESVTAVFPDGSRLVLTIENFWFQKGRVILKFAGYDSIETAEALRNSEICIPESDAVELGSDEYFDWQLKECSVETAEGENIGAVTDVMRTGGTEVLLVQGAEKEYMIPFAGSICTEVDIENKRIIVDAPEGLLDF